MVNLITYIRKVSAITSLQMILNIRGNHQQFAEIKLACTLQYR